MPVTAKLSRTFYERLGDEIANELVDWFNQVAATYRADLERLNELNFQRFDAKLEQRFAEVDARMERRLAELNAKMQQRFADVDGRIERLRSEFREHRAEVAATLARQKTALVWSMFAFWVGTVVPLAGLMVALG